MSLDCSSKASCVFCLAKVPLVSDEVYGDRIKSVFPEKHGNHPVARSLEVAERSQRSDLTVIGMKIKWILGTLHTQNRYYLV